MTRSMKAALLTATTAACLAGGLSQAWASCKQGFCVHGSDANGYHTVVVTSQNGFRRINFLIGSKQSELQSGGVISFPVRSGRTYHYSVQGCAERAFLQASICTAWVQFEHTVD